ncbi:MAG TPA: family 1 encapsulin nanocompartment shell protein [Acidimicrobiales bacterium]|nr:family 1 encapsulin nanocompartment shell protein [Acidimicrobiales bacterium]
MRELAPISDEAWAQIDQEARRSLKHHLAARRLVDFKGPLGWEHSAVDLGRVDQLVAGPTGGVEAARRAVLPLVEFRALLSLSRSELAAAERGATDLDLAGVIAASRSAAAAEDGAIFHGYAPGGISGIAPSSPHEPVGITDDYVLYPEHAAKAVAVLRGADIAGPYAIAMGARCFTGVTETTEHGGYPVFEHLRQILGGPVVWAPAVDGAVVLSQRGGDFDLTIGQDYSIGYLTSDATTVQLYIEESLAFHINTPEAAVHLSYR